MAETPDTSSKRHFGSPPSSSEGKIAPIFITFLRISVLTTDHNIFTDSPHSLSTTASLSALQSPMPSESRSYIDENQTSASTSMESLLVNATVKSTEEIRDTNISERCPTSNFPTSESIPSEHPTPGNDLPRFSMSRDMRGQSSSPVACLDSRLQHNQPFVEGNPATFSPQPEGMA